MASPAPDSSSNIPLPSVDPSDSAEVVRCLERAHELWREGQPRDAVRALQRGAAAAEEDGNDLRALTLARVAADLSAQVGASAAPAGAGDDTTRPVPSEAPLSARGGSLSPAPPSVSPRSVSPASGAQAGPSPSVAKASPSSPAASGKGAGSRRNTQPTTGAKRATEPVSVRSPNGATPAPFAVTSREVRVVVKRSALDENLFVVRPLTPGARIPAGAREALLVFPDVDPPASSDG